MKVFAVGLVVMTCFSCAPVVSQVPPPPSVANAAQTSRPAPTPEAVDQSGEPVDFAALYRRGPVLVYFYPKADTPGCTAQACSLRDSYEKLTQAGLTVIGVSTDDAAAQKAFQEKYRLPFMLIADPEGKVLEAFGVNSRMGMARREAFLIRDGEIVWHDGSASTDKQAEDVLEQLESWKR